MSAWPWHAQNQYTVTWDWHDVSAKSAITLFTVQQKAQCRICFAELKSIGCVQHCFRHALGKMHQTTKLFVDGSVSFKKQGPFRNNTQQASQELVKKMPNTSTSLVLVVQKKSIARSLVLQIQKKKHKWLLLHDYKIQARQQIEIKDKHKKKEFASFMLNEIDEHQCFWIKSCLQTRQHVTSVVILINTTAEYGDHNNLTKFMSMYETLQKWMCCPDYFITNFSASSFFAEKTICRVNLPGHARCVCVSSEQWN